MWMTGSRERVCIGVCPWARLCRALCTLLVWHLIFPVASGQTASKSIVEIEKLGPFGGDVRSLLVDASDPKVVFLGTSDGRLYRSEDTGLSWNHLYPGIGRRQFVVDTLVQHPVYSDWIYAGTWDLKSDGGGLFLTQDRGRTWNLVPLPGGSHAVRDIAICRERPEYMIVGTLHGAFVSSDGGGYWKAVGHGTVTPASAESVGIDPKDPNFLFVGTWRLGFTSADFGETWARAEKGMLLDSDVFAVNIDDENPEVIFASTCSGIYKSVNRAKSWVRLKVFPKRSAVRTHATLTDPLDRNRIYAATTEGLLVSENGGSLWRRLTPSHLTIDSIQIATAATNRTLLIGTENHGVLRSQDEGHSWVESNVGFIHRQISKIVPFDQRGFYTGVLSDGRAGGVFLFESQERQWVPMTSGLTRKGIEILSFIPEVDGAAVVGTRRGLYWRHVGKSQWKAIRGETRSLEIHDLVFDPRGAWIYAGTSQGIYRAPAKTLRFEKRAPEAPGDRVYAVVFSSESVDRLFAATNKGVYQSHDGGVTWAIESTEFAHRTLVEAIAVCPGERDHLLVGSVSGLFETLDGGSSWQQPRDGRLGVDIPAVIFLDGDGRQIMAADKTFGGVFYSNDAGQSWEKIHIPGFDSPVRTLTQDPEFRDHVYLGTNSEGVYRLKIRLGDVADDSATPLGRVH